MRKIETAFYRRPPPPPPPRPPPPPPARAPPPPPPLLALLLRLAAPRELALRTSPPRPMPWKASPPPPPARFWSPPHDRLSRLHPHLDLLDLLDPLNRRLCLPTPHDLRPHLCLPSHPCHRDRPDAPILARRSRPGHESLLALELAEHSFPC